MKKQVKIMANFEHFFWKTTNKNYYVQSWNFKL